MATLRNMIDGTGISIHSEKDGLVHHLKEAAKKKVDYDVAQANLHSKLAPMQKLIELSQRMHPQAGPNPQDASDPFQNPYMQQGEGGPGGVGQGMENQDDLARTGQMKKPSPGGVDNYLKKGAFGQQPGKQEDDANKRLETPDSRLAQGKPQQRSTSGNRPPGKQTQTTEGKPVKKKGRKIRVDISDDSMKAYGTSEGVGKAWDTRGRGTVAGKGRTAVATSYGWQSTQHAGGFTHPNHPGDKLYLNKADGGWKHVASTGHVTTSSHGSLLSDHLKRLHGPQNQMAAATTTSRGVPVKTTGDYHDNAGVSMPSVATGLSALSTKRRNALPDSAFAIPRLRKLPLDTPGRVRNAAARVNQTGGATPEERRAALAKIRHRGAAKNVDISDKPTSKQKSWLKQKSKIEKSVKAMLSR